MINGRERESSCRPRYIWTAVIQASGGAITRSAACASGRYTLTLLCPLLQQNFRRSWSQVA